MVDDDGLGFVECIKRGVILLRYSDKRCDDGVGWGNEKMDAVNI